MHRRVIRLSLLLSVTSLSVWLTAGQFKYGFNQSESGTFKMSRPPDFPLSGISITLLRRPGVPFPDEKALDLAIEQGLASELTIVPKNGENSLVFTISQYIPVSTKTYTTTQSIFSKKAGGLGAILNQSAAASNSGGIQEVHWQSSGDLQVGVLLLDKGGSQLESFIAKGNAQRDVVLSRGGQQVTDPQSLPTPQTLMTDLVTSTAHEVQKHYLRTTDSVSAMLTVDGELRPINESLAMNGKWKEALAAYEGVSVPKHPADRLYNMAVCQEALAYTTYDETRNPSDAAPLFTEALKLYDQALQLDPKEKYFQQAKARIEETRGNFARAVEQWQAQQNKHVLAVQALKTKQEQQKQESDAQQQRQAALQDTRPDTANEAAFRKSIDLRLRGNASPPPATVANLKESGASLYQLQPLDIERVLSQETIKLQKHQQALAQYKQAFSDVAKDKVIDSDDRQMLNDLATRAELSNSDIKAIESQFQFKETGLQATSTAPASAKTSVRSKQTKPAGTQTSAANPAKTDTTSTQPAEIKPQP